MQLVCFLCDQPTPLSREGLPGKFHWNSQLCRSGRPLGPARPAPAAVDAVQSLTNSVVVAALAPHRKGLSTREKIIENGSLQLEICYPVGPPDRALDGLKINVH